MTDCVTQSISNSNESVDPKPAVMDSVPQSSPQTPQPSTQQSPTAQLLIGQQMSPIVTPMDVSQPNHNSVNDSSVSSGVSVSMNANIVSTNASEGQNSLSVTPNPSVSSSMPSASIATSLSTPGAIAVANTQSPQLIVSSSQPQLVSTTQTANGLIGQPLGHTITSMANQTVHMATGHQNQMQPLLQTSVQPTGQNQMNVTMSQMPQVQVIQQPIGTATGTYQLQQVYPQGMILNPGNLTIQNMPFGAHNQGLSLQIPFSGTGGVSTGTMPITSIAAKPPIMSKGVAISPLTQSQHHMLSSLKQNISPAGTQIIKQVLPQQFVPHSAANQTVVISQLLPHQNQHSVQQSILPNVNKTFLETPKGKPFGSGSVRSAFGNKMLSHSGAIQPKSPILPATSMSSQLLANSQFKTPFTPNQNTTQLIQTQSNLITNPQILGSFQTLGPGLTWTTSPQSTHLVAPNGSPIFIRGPGQGGEHMFISTSNMSSPQIQALSMQTPISVHNSTATQMHVNAVTTQQSQITHTPMNQMHQHLPTNTVYSMAATTVSSTQPTAMAPTPAPSNTSKSKRQASSVATQTGTQTIAQKVESTSNLKPIAPAKPKPNSQHSASNKLNKDINTATTALRSTSVGATQTVQPTPSPSNATKPQTQSTKSDAANQTTKISVATETQKNNNQVSSSRTVGEQNKQSSVKSNSSTNTGTETIELKVNSNIEITKTPPKRPAVEKKDASTEQDCELSTNFFAQNSHKTNSNLVQTNNSSNSLTQVNGQQIPVLSDLNRQDISKPPQKAIVKPQKSQILTHVIDGYIIQESANPFPVNGVGYSSESRTMTDGIDGIETLKAKNKNENSNSNASSSKNRTNSDRHLCVNCGAKRKANFKGNRNLKRFCSQSCSEKFTLNKNMTSGSRLKHNVVTGHLDNDVQRTQDLPNESINDLDKQSFEEKKKVRSLVKRNHENSIEVSNSTKTDKIVTESYQKIGPTTSDVAPMVNCVPPTVTTVEDSGNAAIAGLYIPPGGRNPLQWTVNDVYEFVRNLQGCTEYADEFRSQEIDGQALMLIKEDHLMNTMNMKLGPALKICSKINALREDAQKQS